MTELSTEQLKKTFHQEMINLYKQIIKKYTTDHCYTYSIKQCNTVVNKKKSFFLKMKKNFNNLKQCIN